jgi:hypothetical protein
MTVLSAAFSPDDSILACTYFSWDEGSPFNGSFNFTVHFGAWETSNWSQQVEVITWNNSMYDQGEFRPFMPWGIRWSSDSTRLLFFDQAPLDSNLTSRMEVRNWPGLSVVAAQDLPTVTWDADWSPDGLSLVVATGPGWLFDNTSGAVQILRASDLTATRNLSRAGWTFTGVDWSPDGRYILSRGYERSFDGRDIGCPDFYVLKQHALEVLYASNLTVAKVVGTRDAAGAMCGTDDYILGTSNVTAWGSWDPSGRYLMIQWGNQVFFENTTHWATVYHAEAPLVSSNGPDLDTNRTLIANPQWIGRSGDAMVELGYLRWCNCSGRTEWGYGFRIERMVLRADSWLPSVSIGGASALGTVDLFPGRKTSELGLSFWLDSQPYAYQYISVGWQASATEAIEFEYTIANGSLRQTAGSDLATLSFGAPGLSGNGSNISIVFWLTPSWNISTDGVWNPYVRFRLADDRIGAAPLELSLQTHLRVSASGPLVILDEHGNTLPPGAFLNATPTLRLGWGQVTFAGFDVPLEPWEFDVAIVGPDGGPVVIDPPTYTDDSGTRTWLFDESTITVNAMLVGLPPTAIDTTSVAAAVRVDGLWPLIVPISPTTGQWTNATSVRVSFSAADERSGISLVGAVVLASWAGTPAVRIPAVATGASDGDPWASFEATLTLPLGARVDVDLILEVRDVVGNVGNLALLLRLDREPPSLQVEDWPDWVTGPDALFSWKCLDGAVGVDANQSYAAFSPGPSSPATLHPGLPDDSSTNTTGQRFLLRLSLDEGTGASIRFACSDAAGNTNESDAYRVDTDQTAPVVASVIPGGQGTLVGTHQVIVATIIERTSGVSAIDLWLNLSTDAGQTMQRISPTSIRLASPGRYNVTFEVDLAEGNSNRVQIGGADNAGNRFNWTAITLVVNSAPSLSIVAPMEGSVLYTGLVHFEANVSDPDGDTISVRWVDGSTGALIASGERASAVLPPGPHDVRVVASDGNGHDMVANLSFEVAPGPSQAPADVPLLPLALLLASVGTMALVLLRSRKRRRGGGEA